MTYDVLPAGQTSIWVSMLPMLIITLVVMGAFYYFVYAQGGGGKAMNVGRAKVKDQADQGRKATFADVARGRRGKGRAGRNCGVFEKPAAL